MGLTISKISITLFELVNELFVAVGAGVPGLIILAKEGVNKNRYIATLFVTSFTTACLMYAFKTHEFSYPDKRKIIVITGCDSGLGFSFAQHAYELGFTVLAGCYNLQSDGAKKLLACGDRMRRFEIDITSMDSVNKAVKYTESVLAENEDNVLWAIINNAGVMVFGEFEWQTENLIQRQLGINLMGTMRFTNAFCYLLRAYKCRVINISSHCALVSLPGLAVYGATKAAIYGFSDALRVEMSKYGVQVIIFIPGGFVTQSDIMVKHAEYVQEMSSAFTKEQETFYGPYFKKYHKYLSGLRAPNTVKKIANSDLYKAFEHALLSKTPNVVYKVEPWQYFIDHALMRVTPYALRDHIVEKIMQMPQYEPTQAIITKHID